MFSNRLISETRDLVALLLLLIGRVFTFVEDFFTAGSGLGSSSVFLSSSSSTRGSMIVIFEASCIDPPEVLRVLLGVPSAGLVLPDLLGVEDFPRLCFLLSSIFIGSSGISRVGVFDLSDNRLLRRVGVCKRSIPDMCVGLTDRDLTTFEGVLGVVDKRLEA